MFFFFLFKQKTAYEMRISDWSSDVCSSDLTKLVVGVEDREIGLQPDQLGMAAEHSRRDGVERAEPRHAFHGVADHPFHPVPHFARRLVGEGDGKDFRR